MKAITLRQPWAWAVIHAGKDIENRSWTTRFRGTVAIHAGTGWDGFDDLPRGVRRPNLGQVVHGAIIGFVDIIDVVESSRSRWYYDGNFGFVLENPRPLPQPIPCQGALNFWTVPPEIVRSIDAQGIKVTPGDLLPWDEIERKKSPAAKRHNSKKR